MKKLLFMAALCLVSGYVYSQNAFLCTPGLVNTYTQIPGGITEFKKTFAAGKCSDGYVYELIHNTKTPVGMTIVASPIEKIELGLDNFGERFCRVKKANNKGSIFMAPDINRYRTPEQTKNTTDSWLTLLAYASATNFSKIALLRNSILVEYYDTDLPNMFICKVTAIAKDEFDETKIIAKISFDDASNPAYSELNCLAE